MKSEKGVTLTALVVYIVVFSIILAIMANVSNYFYRNVSQIQYSPKYISEFNKFNMFFILDAKRNTDIKNISPAELEFADGTKYTYKNNKIYRNEEEIAKYIRSFSFKTSEYTVNNFTKKIITVDSVIGNSKEQMTRNIDFVLKYW